MRILFFVHSLRRGGAERVLLELALGFRKRGHVVELVSWLDVDEYTEERYKFIPRHFLLPKEEYRWTWSIPRAAKSLCQIVEQFRPDVIELHTPTVAWVMAWANLNIPAVHVLHGYGSITSKGSIKDKVVRILDRLVSRYLKASFIVVSKPMVQVAAAHFSIKPSRFVCVPNGIDLDNFNFKQKIPDRSPSILMLGTLSPKKGQAHGIRAFKGVLDKFPGARLKIVGNGPNRPALEALVKVSGLEGKVDFFGRRDDVPYILSTTHILWQLSESEGLPMVVLEAMAAGVPVVGFNVRGTRDVVIDNKTGHLMPYADVTAIANTTAELLKDASRYHFFAANGRDQVERFYSNESMIDGHENTLKNLINGN